MRIHHLDVDQTWHSSNCAGDDWGVYTHAVDLLAWYTGQSEIKYVPRDMGHSFRRCHALIFNARTRRSWEKREKMQKQGDQVGREHLCPLLHQGIKGGVVPQISTRHVRVTAPVGLCVLLEELVTFVVFNLILAPIFNGFDSDQELAVVSRSRVDGLTIVHNVPVWYISVQTDAASVKYQPAAPSGFCCQKQTLSWKAGDYHHLSQRGVHVWWTCPIEIQHLHVQWKFSV